jgi:hypothetical protein
MRIEWERKYEEQESTFGRIIDFEAIRLVIVACKIVGR